VFGPSYVNALEPPACETDLARNVSLARRFDDDINKEDVFGPLTEGAGSEAEDILAKHVIFWIEHEIMAVYPSTELWHRHR